MKRENGRGGEEPRDLPRVSEEELVGAGLDGVGREAEDDWSSTGTEDPAFFIRIADGE